MAAGCVWAGGQRRFSQLRRPPRTRVCTRQQHAIAHACAPACTRQQRACEPACPCQPTGVCSLLHTQLHMHVLRMHTHSHMYVLAGVCAQLHSAHVCIPAVSHGVHTCMHTRMHSSLTGPILSVPKCFCACAHWHRTLTCMCSLLTPLSLLSRFWAVLGWCHHPAPPFSPSRPGAGPGPQHMQDLAAVPSHGHGWQHT